VVGGGTSGERAQTHADNERLILRVPRGSFARGQAQTKGPAGCTFGCVGFVLFAFIKGGVRVKVVKFSFAQRAKIRKIVVANVVCSR
jgi:hypothetical protein